MSNVVELPRMGWTDLDPDQIRRNLAHTFPGVLCWLGEYTGSWWALVGDRLVEAPTPGELADRILAARRPAYASFGGRARPPEAAVELPSRVSAVRAEQTAEVAHSHRAPLGHRFGRLGRMIGRAA